MLRLSVMLYYQPELLDEYQRLRKAHVRTQKEMMYRPTDKDPLAEFELLFKKWERCQHKIKKQTFWQEKEIEYQIVSKRITEEYMRDLELVESYNEQDRERRMALSVSPNR